MVAEQDPEAGPGPEVSVVVSTFERPESVSRLVAALEAQTLPRERFEVVLVDNGSRDGTPRVLEELARRSPLALRTVRVGRNRGAANGRNAGLQHVRGAVVAFTDDDCVPAPGWLEEGLAAMGQGRRLVVGRTLPVPGGREGPFSRTVRVESARYMETCNVFYRRGDLIASGGFDGRFGVGGEDTDLGLRLAEDGVEVVYAAEALVHHEVKPSSLAGALRVAARWTDLPLVVRRHPQVRDTHLHHRVFWKRSHPPALLALVGLALAPRWPAALALTVPWLRYRLVVQPITPGRRRRLTTLPGAFAVDVVEVATMLRGSVRHRTLVL